MLPDTSEMYTNQAAIVYQGYLDTIAAFAVERGSRPNDDVVRDLQTIQAETKAGLINNATAREYNERDYIAKQQAENHLTADFSGIDVALRNLGIAAAVITYLGLVPDTGEAQAEFATVQDKTPLAPGSGDLR